MNFGGNARRQIAVRAVERNSLDRLRNAGHIGFAKHHREKFQAVLFRDGQFRQRITVGIDGVRTEQKDEQVRFLDRFAYAIVILLARRKIGAIEEYLLTLIAECQIN